MGGGGGINENGNQTAVIYHDFKRQGYDFFVGVPCSFLRGFIKELESDSTMRYIPATREDVAMSIAVGAKMAGRKPLVFIQSSGLGHLVNVITSLLTPYDIPVHILISLRKSPFEHFEMHRIAHNLLKLVNYEHFTIIEESTAE